MSEQVRTSNESRRRKLSAANQTFVPPVEQTEAAIASIIGPSVVAGENEPQRVISDREFVQGYVQQGGE